MHTPIGAYEAKTRLPELLRAVATGESFVITLRDRAVAQLVPVQPVGDRVQAVQAMQDFMARQPGTFAADLLDTLRQADQR